MEKAIFHTLNQQTFLKILFSSQPVKNEDIFIDFFSGSATTAHSVMDLNKEDNINRKYIMIQLPECLDDTEKKIKENQEAIKLCEELGKPKTIAEIGKERIRRVIKKIKKENKSEDIQNLDLGFKVFKLDKSNFNVWDQSDSDPIGIHQQLKMHLDSLIDENSSEQDILYEILLKSGYELTTKIKTKTLANKTVYSISNDALLICLDKELSEEVILEMAKLKPARVVCLDMGFYENDQLKTNAVETMRSHGVTDFKTV